MDRSYRTSQCGTTVNGDSVVRLKRRTQRLAGVERQAFGLQALLRRLASTILIAYKVNLRAGMKKRRAGTDSHRFNILRSEPAGFC